MFLRTNIQTIVDKSHLVMDILTVRNNFCTFCGQSIPCTPILSINLRSSDEIAVGTFFQCLVNSYEINNIKKVTYGEAITKPKINCILVNLSLNLINISDTIG